MKINTGSIINKLLPQKEISDTHLRKKTEYTVIFLILLNAYIIPAVAIEAFFGIIAAPRIVFNLILILLCLSAFIFVKKGYINFTILFLVSAGLLKSTELMLLPRGSYFFSLLLMVILSTAVIHTDKKQLYFVYISGVILLVLKVVISWKYTQEISISVNDFSQTIHSVHAALLFIFSVTFINRIVEREIKLSRKLERIANLDMLTGAYNRRKFSEEDKNAGMKDMIFSRVFCMIDIDHFKTVNDRLGHETGDFVLEQLTQLIKKILRPDDMLYRWGGEEFLVVLACDDIKDACQIAERIRMSVEENVFYNNVKITISTGISKLKQDEDFMAPVRRADIALYQAKESGRNRIETA